MRFYYLKLFPLFLGLMFFTVANLQAQHIVYVYLSDGSTAVYDRVDSLVCTVEEQEIYADGKIYRTSISEVDSVIYDSMPFVTPGQLVDLGLSVKWAGWNVGASRPEEYGGYYAWGELYEKSDYDLDTYQYYDQESYEWIFIGNNISGTQYDVARAQWGGNWRMPTLSECQELIEKCTWTWTIYNGVAGQKVTGLNGNSIFLPAAGYRLGSSVYRQGSYGDYWSGTLYEGYGNGAYCLSFYYGNVDWYHCTRGYGHSVRPVSE